MVQCVCFEILKHHSDTHLTYWHRATHLTIVAGVRYHRTTGRSYEVFRVRLARGRFASCGWSMMFFLVVVIHLKKRTYTGILYPPDKLTAGTWICWFQKKNILFWPFSGSMLFFLECNYSVFLSKPRICRCPCYYQSPRKIGEFRTSRKDGGAFHTTINRDLNQTNPDYFFSTSPQKGTVPWKNPDTFS